MNAEAGNDIAFERNASTDKSLEVIGRYLAKHGIDPDGAVEDENARARYGLEIAAELLVRHGWVE